MSADDALLELLQALNAVGYRFMCPAPLDHARAIVNRDLGETLEDVFGWNLPFDPAASDAAMVALLQRADALESRGALAASRYRIASCNGLLFLHSAFPTLAADSVFFGPDSYRFVEFLKRNLPTQAARIADIGAGSGVGGLVAARQTGARDLVLTDINPKALRLAAINARAANIIARCVETSALEGVEGAFDVVIANPPYLADEAKRLYRDGGDLHGARVSLEWAEAALPRLAPGGMFLLYTGSAILAGGEDPLRAALAELAPTHACTLHYEEIEKSVWREELARPAYEGVARIAVVGAVFTAPP